MKVKCQAKKNQGSNTLVARFAVVVTEIPDTEFSIDDHTEKVDFFRGTCRHARDLDMAVEFMARFRRSN